MSPTLRPGAIVPVHIVVSLKSAFDSDPSLASFWLKTMLKCSREPCSFSLVWLDLPCWTARCELCMECTRIPCVVQASPPFLSVLSPFRAVLPHHRCLPLWTRDRTLSELDTLGTLSDGQDRIIRDLLAPCQRFRALVDIQNDYILTLYLESKGVYVFLKFKDLDVFIMLISTVCHNRDDINGDFLRKNKFTEFWN